MTEWEKKLELALKYAARGWRVIWSHWPVAKDHCSCPRGKDCTAVGKHPGRDWVNEATTRPDVIRAWFTAKPHANVSIVTGPESGIFVLDIDPASGGEESIKKLVATHGDIPMTVTFFTGSGGYHHLFKHPGTHIPTKANIDAGIDIRGNGGQIIAPPSRNANGFYTIDEDAPLDTTEVADAPAWLFSLISSKGVDNSQRSTGRFNIQEALNGVDKGRRDDTIFKLACKMRDEDIPEDMALDWIGRAAANCDPPFPLKLAEEKVRWAYKKYEPRVKWDHAIMERRDIPRVEMKGPDDWVKPFPLVNPEVSEVPEGILPDWLEAYVNAVSTAIQVPRSMVVTLALTTIAATVAKKGTITVKSDWKETLNLYTVVACVPSTRKSPTFREVTAPLYAYERFRREEEKDAYAALIVERDTTKSKLEKMRRDYMKSDATTPPPEMAKMHLRLMELEHVDLPTYIMQDTTPEKLTTMLFRNKERIAVLSADGAGVFAQMCGRYSGIANPEIYIMGYTGDEVKVARMGRADEHLRSPLITLGLAVQPKIIRGVARMKAADQGLLARILYCFPYDNVGNRTVDAPPIPYEIREAYSNHLELMLKIKMPGFRLDLEGRRVQEMNTLVFDGDVNDEDSALGSFIKFERDLEKERGATYDDDLREWLGKLGGNTARLIGLLHIAECIEHCDSPDDIWKFPIQAATVDHGKALAKFYAKHAVAAIEEMQADPIKSKAIILVNWMRKKGAHIIYMNDIVQKLNNISSEKVVHALTYLIDRGYIQTEDPNEKLGVRANHNVKFRVNPNVIAGDFRSLEEDSDD